MSGKPHPDWLGKGYEHKHVMKMWTIADAADLAGALDQAQTIADEHAEDSGQLIMVEHNVEGYHVERVALVQETMTDGSVAYNVVLS